jgi:hypothetical protein
MMRPSMTDSSVLCFGHRIYQTGTDDDTKRPVKSISDILKERVRKLDVMSDVLEVDV